MTTITRLQCDECSTVQIEMSRLIAVINGVETSADVCSRECSQAYLDRKWREHGQGARQGDRMAAESGRNGAERAPASAAPPEAAPSAPPPAAALQPPAPSVGELALGPQEPSRGHRLPEEPRDGGRDAAGVAGGPAAPVPTWTETEQRRHYLEEIEILYRDMKKAGINVNAGQQAYMWDKHCTGMTPETVSIAQLHALHQALIKRWAELQGERRKPKLQPTET